MMVNFVADVLLLLMSNFYIDYAATIDLMVNFDVNYMTRVVAIRYNHFVLKSLNYIICKDKELKKYVKLLSFHYNLRPYTCYIDRLVIFCMLIQFYESMDQKTNELLKKTYVPQMSILEVY